MTPAILFEPDGYLLSGRWLMGRQSAGNGFLRAAVKCRGDEPVTGYTPFAASADIFKKTVAEIDPAATTSWISARRLDQLAEVGLLYRPDQILGPMARQRLRVGPAAYSLCGVTHTLATHTTLDALAKIVTEPVMAWDAVVCTSAAALSVVTTVLDHEAEYQRWRSGHAVTAPRPLLPVIPLGVHCEDFDFTAEDRAAARLGLGIAPEAVVAVSAGRLSVNGKAHPFAMLSALQRVAAQTGMELVLILAGQAFNKAISDAFEGATATFAPDVRTVFVDGKDIANYRAAWAAGDLFISLADSIQETFGLTPLEAMAAGLPALVSDWNGYKDTVRDGVDGFRVPTWAPEPGGGENLAQDYESGLKSYEEYLFQANTAVAVDFKPLIARLTDLVTKPDLRRRMGAAGQARARAAFDWPLVYGRYQELWAEQARIRGHALASPRTAAWLGAAPRRGSDHLGPFDTFADYPTNHITVRTTVSMDPEFDTARYRALIANPLLNRLHVAPAVFELIRQAVLAGDTSVEQLARTTGISQTQLIEAVARLAKFSVLDLS